MTEREMEDLLWDYPQVFFREPLKQHQRQSSSSVSRADLVFVDSQERLLVIEPANVRLRIADPEFTFGSGSLQVNLSAATANVPILLGAAENREQPLGPSRGIVRVEIRSSNEQVVRPTAQSIDFRPGESSRTLTLQLAGRGDAVLSLQAPAGFNLPAGKREILVTVR